MIPEVDRLLSQRIDKLVWQFQASTPEFYEKYRVARAVVSGATLSDTTETPAIPVIPVAKVA